MYACVHAGVCAFACARVYVFNCKHMCVRVHECAHVRACVRVSARQSPSTDFRNAVTFLPDEVSSQAEKVTVYFFIVRSITVKCDEFSNWKRNI